MLQTVGARPCGLGRSSRTLSSAKTPGTGGRSKRHALARGGVDQPGPQATVDLGPGVTLVASSRSAGRGAGRRPRPPPQQLHRLALGDARCWGGEAAGHGRARGPTTRIPERPRPALREPPTASALERLGSVIPGLAPGDLEAGADLGVAVDADDLLAAGAGPALEPVG